jgi:hypothetical protein
MHGAVCLHGVPGSAYPFTLILCNMEDQMLPGIHWAGKGKAYSFSLETVRKSGHQANHHSRRVIVFRTRPCLL